MISMESFGNKLGQLGFNFYSGVPCSFLKPMINFAINNDQFIMAANEGDAVAIAAGASLGGTKSVFLCQNSGLTNAVSPLTSLNYTFEIPVLGFVSLRGELGVADEPQHELMGAITDKMLDIMQVQYAVLSIDEEEALRQLEEANMVIESGKSFFFIVKKDTFTSVKLMKQEAPNLRNAQLNNSMSDTQDVKRIEALKVVQSETDKNTVLLATTGVTGRELFELEDKNNQFYMVGSMGCISSLGLGLALAKPNIKVVVIDGDGSLLMRMGCLATNAYYSPTNLYHLLLDNGLHESTGGQKTVSSHIDFMQIAYGARYEVVDQLNNLSDLTQSLKIWGNTPKLTFGYLKTSKGIKDNLGRPTITPKQVKDRFMSFVKECPI
ncbi:phosphonopyruvate decarboxylase [Bacillus ndiopicus]|uniref:phosphonopyruvate decarboxylase n=1 Tax=Bacillus ndiopicus TaxID=1347368 RepID=UPI0005A68D15|nr:phosphonopyruvate decarboxylase [Bacillus ndiopicus]